MAMLTSCSAMLWASGQPVCRFACTQKMVDQLMAPQEFLLSERYAAAVKTLGLALFFMPVLPISIIIAFCGKSALHVTVCFKKSCVPSSTFIASVVWGAALGPIFVCQAKLPLSFSVDMGLLAASSTLLRPGHCSACLSALTSCCAAWLAYHILARGRTCRPCGLWCCRGAEPMQITAAADSAGSESCHMPLAACLLAQRC